MVLGLNINMGNIENYTNHEAYLLIDNPHIFVLTLDPHILQPQGKTRAILKLNLKPTLYHLHLHQNRTTNGLTEDLVAAGPTSYSA